MKRTYYYKPNSKDSYGESVVVSFTIDNIESETLSDAVAESVIANIVKKPNDFYLDDVQESRSAWALAGKVI